MSAPVRIKRGDVRTDGKIFWAYQSLGRGEYWVTREKFTELKLRESSPEKRAQKAVSDKKSYQKHKLKRASSAKLYREKNKAALKLKKAKYAKCNCDKLRKYHAKYREENREKARERQERYRARHQKRIVERQRVWSANKRSADPVYRAIVSARTRLGIAIRAGGYKKSATSQRLLGCSWEAFVKHIEAHFTDGMSWENYGFRGWHIDHVVPVSSAKTLEELIPLLHYTNLQPLWAKDNFAKSDKILN